MSKWDIAGGIAEGFNTGVGKFLAAREYKKNQAKREAQDRLEAIKTLVEIAKFQREQKLNEQWDDFLGGNFKAPEGYRVKQLKLGEAPTFEAVDQLTPLDKAKTSWYRSNVIKNMNQSKISKSTPSSEGNISPYQHERMTRNLESVQKIRDRVSSWNTGAGSYLSILPGTEARGFKGMIDTLKANITFGELTAMREASKTGGALGQVSDREGQLLGAALGSLDQAQNQKDFKNALDNIENSITRWQNAVQKYGGNNNKNSVGSNNRIINPQDALSELKRRGKI